MKKIVFIALCIALVTVGKAQSSYGVVAMTNPNASTVDTVTNSTPEGPVFKVPAGFHSTVSIVLVVTKISGTVAGNIQWQGSNDGVNYATLDTTALSDASANYAWSTSPKKFVYYKANIAGTGTLSASYKASVAYTKQL